MAHNVTRLYKNRNTFYFRVRIPKDLLLYFGGKQDVKRSLHTKSLTQAKRLLKVWDCRTEQLFTTMRLGMLTREQIARIADAYMHDNLDSYEESRSLGYGIPPNEDILDVNLDLYDEFIANAREALAFNKFKRYEKKVDMLIEEYALDVVKGTPDYVALARAVLIKDIEILRIEKERAVGNYNNGYDDQPLTESRSLIAQSVALPLDEQLLLSDVIDKRIADYKLKVKGEVTETYIKDFENICNLFKRIVGDKDIKSISRDDIRHFLATLKKIPKHINKKPQFLGKSIEEILEMGISDTLNDNTIRKYTSFVSSLFVWAVQEGILDKNPVDGLVPPKSKTSKASSKRNIFDKEDLTRLVEGLVKVWEKDKFRELPERFWIPIIGLYSGMRENEICQLYIDDVKQDTESGIWYFDVCKTDKDDKSLKTAAAYRPVPIHPVLIDLGFLAYHKKMKAEGSPLIWKNLNKTSKGYLRKFAHWFLGEKSGDRIIYKSFLREYVTTDPKKVFHSFRHTFDDALKQKLVPESIIKELMGHSHGSLALGQYGKPYDIKILMSEAILKLDYGVDFSPLKKIARAING